MSAGTTEPGPYGRAAPAYLEAGWWPIPLPAGEKSPPPVGFTGKDGQAVTSADVARWCNGSDAVVQLGLALDLTVLVPAYALAAVLLWRRAATGYVLATVLLIAGTLHQVSYMVALLFQSTAAVPGAVAFDPFEPVIAALYLAATVAMMVAAGPRHQHSAAGRSADAQRHTAEAALP